MDGMFLTTLSIVAPSLFHLSISFVERGLYNSFVFCSLLYVYVEFIMALSK
jgi:hypothetical protein